jgi:hypothetical protein
MIRKERFMLKGYLNIMSKMQEEALNFLFEGEQRKTLAATKMK